MGKVSVKDERLLKVDLPEDLFRFFPMPIDSASLYVNNNELRIMINGYDVDAEYIIDEIIEQKAAMELSRIQNNDKAEEAKSNNDNDNSHLKPFIPQEYESVTFWPDDMMKWTFPSSFGESKNEIAPPSPPQHKESKRSKKRIRLPKPMLREWTEEEQEELK